MTTEGGSLAAHPILGFAPHRGSKPCYIRAEGIIIASVTKRRKRQRRETIRGKAADK